MRAEASLVHHHHIGDACGGPMEEEVQSPTLEINASRQFTSWLEEQQVSLVFTTYQAGKVFFIGLQPTGTLSIFERTFNRCMGLFTQDSSLYMSSLYQLWRFENVLDWGQTHQDYDRLYIPQVGYVTGDLDIHDIAVDRDGQVIFVNTLFSCLATVSDRYSFTPLWQPPFITKLAAEDRCHLNGLAMRDGQARYVTAVSRSDVTEGWRDRRQEGGCIIDVTSNKIIVSGLSMPHSPRWYRDKLWVLNSGTGEFGSINLEYGTFHALTFCPGYLRGLAFVGDFAIVGLSKPRENKTFSGLPFNETLKEKEVEPRCGLFVINLRSGDIVHSLNLEGIVTEMYDVAVLHGVKRPMAFGFKTDEIRRVLHIA
jgi:uncharacterized protein (TIGR03032 family)